MFGKTGQLCGDVEIESSYKGDGLFVEGWTFKSDSKAMLGFWLFQLITLCANCHFMKYPFNFKK